MIYNQTFRLPKDLIDQVTHYLSLPRGLDDDAYQGEDNTIILATAHFPNGYEMDIKCCGCDEESSWAEAVLFNEHGMELCCSECEQYVLGRWELEYDDVHYQVTIEEEITMTNARIKELYDNMLNHISELVSGADLVDTLHAIGFTDEEIKAEGFEIEEEE